MTKSIIVSGWLVDKEDSGDSGKAVKIVTEITDPDLLEKILIGMVGDFSFYFDEDNIPAVRQSTICPICKYEKDTPNHEIGCKGK